MLDIRKNILIAIIAILVSACSAMAQSHQQSAEAKSNYWDQYSSESMDGQTVPGNAGTDQRDSSTLRVEQAINRRMTIYDYEEPSLQGATMGTIGPQGTDATMVRGLMTAGTVRVSNLSNLETVLQDLANITIVLGHLVGIYYLIRTFRLTVKSTGNVLGGMAKGLSFISIGMLAPTFFNWVLELARDSSVLF